MVNAELRVVRKETASEEQKPRRLYRKKLGKKSRSPEWAWGIPERTRPRGSSWQFAYSWLVLSIASSHNHHNLGWSNDWCLEFVCSHMTMRPFRKVNSTQKTATLLMEKRLLSIPLPFPAPGGSLNKFKTFCLTVLKHVQHLHEKKKLFDAHHTKFHMPTCCLEGCG